MLVPYVVVVRSRCAVVVVPMEAVVVLLVPYEVDAGIEEDDDDE